MARAIMIQGAGSNVGKSTLVAGLARALADRGMRVAPFKPQNMSNNAAVAEGGEIGRAQATQALAARRAATIDMNPVLLKPESESGAQVVVHGRRFGTLGAADYARSRPELMKPVLESFGRLCADSDVVLVEGAGSPAEINLREGDIANMGFAEAADVPVVLIGDVERGGVIAQMVGAHCVLAQADRERIAGFAVNKFRGRLSLFDGAVAEIVRRTGWEALGVVPWFEDAWRLPAEDTLDLRRSPGGRFKVAVPRLRRIANFDDLDPLAAEPGVGVEIVEAGRALPGDADLVLIPGSKSTIADLAHFREQGWDVDLAGHVRRGGHVLGVCGGYQMLGRRISDPEGIEGAAASVEGLGLLDVVTEMRPEKRVSLRQARCIESGAPLDGYEIHLGETAGPDCARAWIDADGRSEGAASPDGRVRGCYLHGLFASDGFRAAFLSRLGAESGHCYGRGIEAALDGLARHVERHLGVDRILALAREV